MRYSGYSGSEGGVDQVMMYTDHELEAMLADPESDLVERKESFRGDVPTSAREAVCAFANDLPNHRRPGVLFVGVRDDGSPSGRPVTDELLRQLADIKTDGNILPPPTLVVAKRMLRGSDVAVVAVTPADAPPVRFRRRIFIRTGPRRGVATRPGVGGGRRRASSFGPGRDGALRRPRMSGCCRRSGVIEIPRSMRSRSHQRGSSLTDLGRYYFEEQYATGGVCAGRP